MANVLVFEDNYLAIQTLEEIGGTVNNAADSLYANASLIALGNDSISTVISSQIITTPEISVGDFNSNISINSTAFSATSYGDSNTHIDAYQAVFSGVVTIGSALILNGELNSNGAPGTAGQVLTSNGTTTYWSDTANNTSFVGSVSAANVVSNAQLSGNLANYVTAFNLSNNLANYATISDPAFTGKITVNTFVTIGNTSQNVVANSSAISINGSLVANSTYFSGQALTANNANNLGGVGAASYVNTSGSYTISGVHTHSGNVVLQSGLSANGGFGTAGQMLYSNGTTGSPYWAAAPSVTVNTAAQYTWTNTHSFTNATTSGNATSGAVTISGGLGVANNIYSGGRIGFSNSTNISVGYFQYNPTTSSVDLVFG